LLGDDFLGQELLAQRQPTHSVHDLLAAYAREGEHRGLTTQGMTPSGLSRRGVFVPSATFNVGGGGGGEASEPAAPAEGSGAAASGKAQATPAALDV
jgi:hypothetical protein